MHVEDSIFITGATGFAGGHLARTLAQRGHRVRALVRPGARTDALREAGIEPVEGQLTRRDDVLRAAEGAATIFHIAAAYRTARQPDSYYHEVNVGGTLNIIEAARKHGASRLVHCSTVGVHGHVAHPPGKEYSRMNPGDVYQLSKLDGEREVQRAIDCGLPAVIARPAAIYGPGDMRLLKLFRSIQKGRFVMFGSGEVNYHLVYVGDLVEGFIQCAGTPAVGQTFILAGPRATTLNELVQMVAQAVGVAPPRRHVPLTPLLTLAAACEHLCRPVRIEPPLHRRRADFFVKNRSFSIDKARRLLGYEPTVQPEEGLKRTAEWYAEQGLLRPVHRAEARSSRAMAQEVAS